MLRSPLATALGLVFTTALSAIACAVPSADEAGSAAAAQSVDASVDAVADGGDIDGGAGVCTGQGSFTVADAEQALGGGWKAPAPPSAACSQADLDAAKALFAAPAGSVTFTALENALGAGCRSCVFTPSTAASWGPFVRFSDGVYTNYAACFAVATNAACARDVTHHDLCIASVCSEDDCGSMQATTACSRKASNSGACKAITTSIQQDCGDSGLEAMEAQCGNIFQVMAMTCGGGAASALDAGVP